MRRWNCDFVLMYTIPAGAAIPILEKVFGPWNDAVRLFAAINVQIVSRESEIGIGCGPKSGDLGYGSETALTTRPPRSIRLSLFTLLPSLFYKHIK